MVELTITLPIIIGAAVIDSINPCAFGVLIFLLSYLAHSVKTKTRMLTQGLVYVLGVFITYLVAGLILLPIIQKLGAFSVGSYMAIGIIVIIAGLLEIKDYFWYGKWFSLGILPGEVERIKMYVEHVSDKPLTAYFLGTFVALVELPCTGAVYLAVLALMSIAEIQIRHIWFLVLYNLIFVLPLIVILVLCVRGMSTKSFEKWRQKNKALMRLLIGLTLLGLGTWMILSVVKVF